MEIFIFAWQGHDVWPHLQFSAVAWRSNADKIFTGTNFHDLVFDRKNLCLAKISRYAVYTVHKTLHYNYNYISRKL